MKVTDPILRVTASAECDRAPPVAIECGGYRVQPLLDGYFTMSLGDLVGVTPAEIGPIQQAAGLDPDSIELPVFAFLLTGQGRTILVDAGTSTGMMASLGKLPAALAALGVAPEAIDAVLITHMHPDHLNGITSAEGTRLFPYADILIAREEWAYWTDAARLEDAAPHIQYILASHRHALAPYREADRIRLFDDGAVVAPGIVARLLPGHTAGHCGFALGDAMLLWGDALHLVPLQLQCPQCALGHDHDFAQSEHTRRQVLGELVETGTLLAGAHVPAPGIGRIVSKSGQYTFVAAGPETGSERDTL
ncbi:MBL fold metallo-hydrolase [Novosphingobium sp.]|uniref:MBL fold metallo-hydrolase n=1 Tax=Novosphingobium sp. TaxID=1874826 RepID=UPI003BAD9330